MNTAHSLSGEPMIVLTDAGDRALIADAVANDAEAPTMSAELATQVLRGEIHPLAAWRTAAALTQGDLAARSGVRSSTISDIENGKIDPRVSTVKALAAAIGVDVDDII